MKRNAHKNKINSILNVVDNDSPFEENSSKIWVSSDDCSITIWNISCSIKYKIQTENESVVSLTRYGDEIWCSSPKKILIYHYITFEKINEIIIDSEEILNCLNVSEQMIICTSQNIFVYDANSKIIKKKIPIGNTNSLTYVEKTKQIWFSTQNLIYVVDSVTFEQIKTLNINSTHLESFEQFIWSSDLENNIVIWDTESLEIRFKIEKINPQPIFALKFVRYNFVSLISENSQTKNVDEKFKNLIGSINTLWSFDNKGFIVWV